MTSTRNPLSDFILTPQQQTLLFAALNSNRPGNAQANAALNMSPSSFGGSPDQGNGVQESPFQDYDYDFGGADSSFDFSFDNGNQKMIGDLPGADSSSRSDTSDHESPDKRSHPNDDDDDEEEEHEPKRRESEEKVAKKPGRKPLTTEPSSKRKAQNRAAQRAFRERKEKHLKDLETKVEELEKASENTNKENEQLRAKVDKMTVELNEYKKRFTAMSSNRSTPSTYKQPFGQSIINNLSDVNFQFEFPKFGALPGPPASRNDPSKRSSSVTSSSNALKRVNSDQMSPMERPKDGPSPSNSSSYSQIGLDQQAKDDLASFSAGLFSSPLAASNTASASRTSFDSHYSNGGGTTTSSPSASSNSNVGASSSCGTSPEPYTQSPLGFKPVDQLSTIGEENSAMAGTEQGFGQFGNLDFNNGNDLSWLSGQQDFQFDPQLFGNYRESQANVLSTGGLDDSFFNDAFDADFVTPYNMPMAKQLKSPEAQKKDLISQIDAAKEDGNDMVGPNGELLTCNKIWEQLQACPKVQNGDFDLDGLCSDLQKKAKCSGHGAVVDEKDFKTVMEKYLGKKDGEACVASTKAAS